MDELQQIRWVALAPGAHINGPGIFRLDSSFRTPLLSRMRATSLLVCPTDSETTLSLSTEHARLALGGRTSRPSLSGSASVCVAWICGHAVDSQICGIPTTCCRACEHACFVVVSPKVFLAVTCRRVLCVLALYLGKVGLAAQVHAIVLEAGQHFSVKITQFCHSL